MNTSAQDDQTINLLVVVKISIRKRADNRKKKSVIKYSMKKLLSLDFPLFTEENILFECSSFLKIH